VRDKSEATNEAMCHPPSQLSGNMAGEPPGKPSTSGSKERSTEKSGERFVEQYGVRTVGKAVNEREK